MDVFTSTVREVGFFLWAYIFGIALVLGGIYFTIRTKFVQFTLLKEALRSLGGRDKKANQQSATDKPKTALSAFRAFCVSESSRVGTGNVVGVAVAIVMGGPGAIFWMWIMAIIGAATGFVESTLGQVYKENAGDRFMGGAMYYFQRAFKFKAPSFIHAGILAFTYVFVFNSIQANTIADTFQGIIQSNIFPAHDIMVSRLVIGIVISIIIMVIIFGGIKRISQVAGVLMPPIIIFYLLVCFAIIIINFPAFIAAMGYIVSSAFGTLQIAGGALGFTFAQAIQHGLRRGLFSNEAGIGSVPIGASTSDVSHPVKQGAVQSFGVLLDTLIICSATAFIIIMSGPYIQGTGAAGVALVRESLGYWTSSNFAYYFLLIMLFFLPFTSLIGNYFYGETCFRFLFKNNTAVNVFKVLGGLTIILAAIAPLDLVWSMGDLFTGTLATLNIIALIILCNVAVKCLNNFKKQKKEKKGTGKEPVFYDDEIGVDTSYWKRER